MSHKLSCDKFLGERCWDHAGTLRDAASRIIVEITLRGDGVLPGRLACGDPCDLVC
jgi:hypothetical protein